MNETKSEFSAIFLLFQTASFETCSLKCWFNAARE